MFRFFHEQNLYQNPKLIHIFATIIHPWSKKTCISFLWILFWYPPLFFASLANSGQIFSLFLYLMKYATPIFFYSPQANSFNTNIFSTSTLPILIAFLEQWESSLNIIKFQEFLIYLSYIMLQQPLLPYSGKNYFL